MNLFKKSLIVAYISILSYSIMSANSNVDPVHGPNRSDDPYNPVPVFYNTPFNSEWSRYNRMGYRAFELGVGV